MFHPGGNWHECHKFISKKGDGLFCRCPNTHLLFHDMLSQVFAWCIISSIFCAFVVVRSGVPYK